MLYTGISSHAHTHHVTFEQQTLFEESSMKQNDKTQKHRYLERQSTLMGADNYANYMSTFDFVKPKFL